MADDQYDINLFNQTVERSQYLKNLHGARNDMFDDMIDMFMMDWDEESDISKRIPGAKVTKSPDSANRILGGARLLTATAPIPTCKIKGDQAERYDADSIEKAANDIIERASRVRGESVVNDLVLSMLLFAETHVLVTKTSDLVAQAKGADKSAIARAQAVADATPFLLDVVDPRGGYPDFDPLGLRAFYREVEMNSGAVLDLFGAKARGIIGDNRYTTVTVCNWWDYDYRMTWVYGKNQPLLQEDNSLPFLPVIVTLGEGTKLFDDPEYQRRPFLYNVWKSELHKRLNLVYTSLYTGIFATLANPQWIEQVNTPGKRLFVNHNEIGGHVVLEPGENFGPVQLPGIPPALAQGLDIAAGKLEESTIYSQALGKPLEGDATFATTSLLAQSGRLPLATPQSKAGFALGDVLKTCLRWLKEDGEGLDELKAADIPEKFELAYKLDVTLPQDKLGNARIAGMLKGIVSNRWIQENVLNITNSTEMAEEVYKEQLRDVLVGETLKKLMAENAQAMAQAQQQQQQGGQLAPNETMAGPGMMPPQEQPAGGGQVPREPMIEPPEGSTMPPEEEL